jgi:hypothetical protein
VNRLRLFRVLIFAQMAIVALAIAASVRLEKTLPDALQSYLRARQDAPFDRKEVGVGAAAIILLAAMVAAWIALLRSWRVGPWIYLATTIAGVMLTLAAGPTVTTAIETALDTSSAAVGGVILAMAFFSDVAPRSRPTEP